MIDEVLRQLMSGKEATVYVVRCGEEIRCAKVYKEASQRSFKQAAAYQEGRNVKNSRQARAMQCDSVVTTPSGPAGSSTKEPTLDVDTVKRPTLPLNGRLALESQ